MSQSSDQLTDRQKCALLESLTLDQQIQIVELADELAIVKKALEYTTKGFSPENLHPNDYACLNYLMKHKTFTEDEF